MIDQPNNKSSDNELEQYGIWVKSEPQDIVEESEEMDIINDTTLEFSPETLDELESPLDTSELELKMEEVSLSHDDSVIDIPLDSILEETAPSTSRKQADAAPAQKPDTSELAVDEISLDDFLDTSSTGIESTDTATASINPEEFLEKEELQEANSEDEIEEIESIDLDLQFDDTIETPLDTVEDEFLTEDVAGFESLEALDSEVFLDTDISKQTQNQEQLDIEQKEAIDVSSMFIEETSKGNIGNGQKSQRTSREEEPQQKKTNLDAFIDNEASLPITELSMDNVTDETQDSGIHKASSSDISITLLNQIAQELASIKDELASLKSQIQTAKQHNETAPHVSFTPTDQKGFFEEEDDETIALTGDELDNILNTASFTVESSEANKIEQTPETALSDFEEPVESLLPEDGNYNTDEKGIEIIDDEQTVETLSEDSEAIAFNADEIVEDLTPCIELNEDETCLEQESELEPLEEIPLEEPDLSQVDLPKTHEELLSTLESADEEPSMSFSHPDDSVLDRIVLSIDGNEQVSETVQETTSIPEFEENTEQEPIELLEEVTLNVTNEEPLSSFHPDELKTQLDDSLFVDNKVKPSVETMPLASTEANASIPDENAPDVSNKLKTDIKTVLLYLDQLLAALPDEKIEEFAKSEYYDTYKKLFEELGII